MYKKLAVFMAIILVSSFISIYIFSDTAEAVPFYDYFGYGASNMMGDNCDVPLGYNWVECMKNFSDPGGTAEGDGKGGKESEWGLSYYDTKMKGFGNYMFECFGVNDLAHDSNPNNMRDNKWDMYAKAYSYGEHENYYPCIVQFIDPSVTENRAWPGQYDGSNTERITWERHYFNVTMNYFKSYSVDYIPLFDAIDSIPFNGKGDDFDSRYGCGGGHYNMNAVSRFANFTWRFVTGDIYNVVWNAGSNTYSVDCNYTYPIHMDLPAGWSYDNITVLCTTNSTEIGFIQTQKIDGTNAFYINGVNGSSYTVTTAGAPTITLVNGQVTGSTIYDNTPQINWTAVSNAGHYQLQIDDNSDFSSPEVDISEINQWTYPSNCAVVSGVVSFTLPDANKLSKGYYYMRVKAYI